MTYLDDLEKLADLKKKKIISDEEFQAQKSALLANNICCSSNSDKISEWQRFVTCWKKTFVYSGRANRSEYWSFMLFNFLISFGIGFFSGFLSVATPLFVYVSYAYSIAMIFPSLAVSFRRLHDTNHNGWWIIGVWALAVLTVIVSSVSVEIASNGPLAGVEFLILPLLCFAGLFGVSVYVFVLTILSGTNGDNKYGTIPQ